MTNSPADDIARAVLDLKQQIHAAADVIAEAHNLPNADTLRLISQGLMTQFVGASSMELDGRAARWRCRFRLYAAENMDEPAADTDPELPPDAPGTTIIAGLPAVGTELAELASLFHGSAVLSGLSPEHIARGLRGLRPTLSRRGGNAAWRLHYDTLETFRGTETRKRGWLARVDVERVKG